MKTNNQSFLNLYLLIIIIGNVLDHYDTSIASFLMPIISKYFFTSSGTTNLIKGYSSLWGSVFGKTLGVVCFHFLVIKYGIKNSIIVSLIGMSIVTFAIILIPHNVEYVSTILFVVLRIMQSFFAVGEYLCCSILLIKVIGSDSRANLASSYYHFSTMFGIILASFVSYIVTLYQSFWHYSFVFGSVVGVVGIVLRYTKLELKDEFISNSIVYLKDDKQSLREILTNNLMLIIKISSLMSLGYFTYTFSFVFLNGFGFISNIAYLKIMQYDYLWLIFDAFLIFVFGRLFRNFVSESLVSIVLLGFVVFIPCVFYSLLQPTFVKIVCIKVATIILGVAYCIPLTSFVYNLCNESNRYIVIGAATIIGNDLIGKSFTPLILFVSDRYNVMCGMIYPFIIVIFSLWFCRREVSKSLMRLVK